MGSYKLYATLIIIVCASWLFVSCSAHNAPQYRPPTPDEQQQIEKAENAICTFSAALCEVLQHQSITYRVATVPWITNGLHWFAGGYLATMNQEDGFYYINIAEYWLNDLPMFARYKFHGLSVVTVLISHELHHIQLSNFDLYENPQRTYKKCIDHNTVKQAALKTLSAMDAWALTPEAASLDYPEQPSTRVPKSGNSIRDCERLKR